VGLADDAEDVIPGSFCIKVRGLVTRY